MEYQPDAAEQTKNEEASAVSFFRSENSADGHTEDDPMGRVDLVIEPGLEHQPRSFSTNPGDAAHTTDDPECRAFGSPEVMFLPRTGLLSYNQRLITFERKEMQHLASAAGLRKRVFNVEEV